jgi:hypothetical protein
MTKRSRLNRWVAEIVVGAAALGAGYVSTKVNHQSEQIQPLVKEENPSNLIFAGNLEGIAHVDEYPVAGSKYTLVHVRQIHPSQKEELSMVGRFVKYSLQTNLFESLESLYAEKPFEAFYPEGVRVEDEQKYNEGLESVASRLHNKNKYTLDVLNATMDPFDEIEGAFFQAPAVASFAIVHNLPWQASGNAKLNSRSTKELEKNPRSTSREVYDDREDFVISQIANEYLNGTHAVTVFGANHDFRNNIQEWNAKHPQNKFSLIVATPTRVAEDDKKSSNR